MSENVIIPIVELIPQKYPFIMIDKLLSATETNAQTSFEIKAENIFIDNGFLSEAGLVENIAQTAAAQAGFTSKQLGDNMKIGFIGAIKYLQIYNLPKLGDTILTTISIENKIFDVIILKGEVIFCGKIQASCEMKLFLNQ